MYSVVYILLCTSCCVHFVVYSISTIVDLSSSTTGGVGSNKGQKPWWIKSSGDSSSPKQENNNNNSSTAGEKPWKNAENSTEADLQPLLVTPDRRKDPSN